MSSPPDIVAQSSAVVPPPPAAPREKVNILLVDDHPGKLTSHEAILAELGENVITATGGREALQLLLKHDCAVILLDVNMPGLDGFETADLIRQRPRSENTPIIFITAYNTTDIDRLEGYRLGAVDYLFLPVIPEVLKAKVTVFVSLERQRQLIQQQAQSLARHNEEQAEQLETIQTLNRELRGANQELEAFSYTISHDLRSPLRALLGYASVLAEDYGAQLDENGHQMLARMTRAVHHMDSLTRDLLSYTRIARQELTMEPIHLETVVEEIVSLNAKLQPPAANITITPVMLPVHGHRMLVKQSLTNILENAVKFVQPGTQPTIRLRTEPREKAVRIWVEDNGIGIDPAYHGKIFGIFERVGDVKDFEGTGIGLAIVARSVQRMGGHCGVVSSLGAGSRFWIELPAPGQSLPN